MVKKHTRTHAPPPVHVGVLLYPGVMKSAVYGLGELLDVANATRQRFTDPPWPEFRVSYWQAVESGVPHAMQIDIQQAPPLLQVIIVPPSTSDCRPSIDTDLLADWLHYQHQKGCILASACAGAFMLAAAGVLDGRSATTHWALADELAAAYPHIKLQPNQMLVDEDDVITAGGLMAWMDLGMRLIQRFAGPTLVMELGKFFIVDTGTREQRFYQTFKPELGHGDALVLKLQHWLQQHYAEPITNQQLANQAHITERTLQRRFNKATGLQPSVYIQQLRIQRARELLETTRTPVDQVVWQVGYDDQSAFRKRFKQWVGLSPSQYRKRFQTALL